MNAVIAFGSALVIATVFVPLAATIFTRFGITSAPRGDRWSANATPLAGGPAIIFAWLLVLFISDRSQLLSGTTIAVCAVMIVGLVDDIRPIRGRWKLSITFALGAGASLVSSPTNLIGAALVGMWVVLLANAYNLSDNMNGLSASLAAIACLTLYTISGNGMRSVSPLGLGGALVGFLPHNARHARVFLGDSGSLALGTFIALTQSQLVLAESEPCSIWACALVAFVPLADTAFVIMTRPLRGRSPLKGGTDHLSHRLTYLGLSPAYAVLVLGIAQAVAALLALLVHRSPLASAGMLTTLAAMAAMLLGSLYERTESRVRSS